jgi:hypothetical protein
MRLAATLVAMAVMEGVSARAESGSRREITVYYGDKAGVPTLVTVQAQSLASGMFKRIEIKLDWRPGNPARPEKGAIVVELVTGTPESFLPGSLAYALPYEGVHIRIFWDRISRTPAPREVLAHVMVHEITHIVQGIARHSGQGIMKARWTTQEEYGMKSKSLSFTQEDVKLIYAGMDTPSTEIATKQGYNP